MSSFTVSARKYRPLKFSEVVGQEHITSTLKNAITLGRVAHAYLFTGPRGVGKTTTARILAKSLNCENPQGAEPCDSCKSCENFKTSQYVDVIEIDAASNRGIDDVRTLRDSVKFAPTHGKYKVYIIDEVHMLTKESFNAFLKTLEEPPPNIIFIFATTEIQKVPITIVSRCQRYDFRRIKVDVIKEQLRFIANSEEVTIDDKTLTLIARRAEGGLRDAESFFDQTVAFCGKTVDYETVISLLNLIDDQSYFKLTKAILEKEYKLAFEISDEVYGHGWSFNDYLEGYTEHLRNLLTVTATGSDALLETADEYKLLYKTYASRFSEGDILRMISFITKALYEMKSSQNQRIKFELTLSFLISLENSTRISELINQLTPSEAEGEKKKPIAEKRPEPLPLPPPTKADEEKAQPTPVQQVTQETTSDLSFAFEQLRKKVVYDKSLHLAFGDSLSGAKIRSEFRGEIDIEVPDFRTREMLKGLAGMLSAELQKITGKEYSVIFSQTNKPMEDSAGDIESYINKSTASQMKNDPYEKAIIEILGGERIA